MSGKRRPLARRRYRRQTDMIWWYPGIAALTGVDPLRDRMGSRLYRVVGAGGAISSGSVRLPQPVDAGHDQCYTGDQQQHTEGRADTFKQTQVHSHRFLQLDIVFEPLVRRREHEVSLPHLLQPPLIFLGQRAHARRSQMLVQAVAVT